MIPSRRRRACPIIARRIFASLRSGETRRAPAAKRRPVRSVLEDTMQKWIVALGVAVAVSAATLAIQTPVRVAAQQSVPEISFDGDINFLKLPPDMNFGEASGVA